VNSEKAKRLLLFRPGLLLLRRRRHHRKIRRRLRMNYIVVAVVEWLLRLPAELALLLATDITAV